MTDNVPNIYISLNHDDYKEVEGQCKAFHETVHRSVEGGYHKSFRLYVTDRLTLEFQGPIVYIKKAPLAHGQKMIWGDNGWVPA